MSPRKTPRVDVLVDAGPLLRASQRSSLLGLTTKLRGRCGSSHFIDEENEEQRVQIFAQCDIASALNYPCFLPYSELPYYAMKSPQSTAQL